jgi:hypothetical protein
VKRLRGCSWKSGSFPRFGALPVRSAGTAWVVDAESVVALRNQVESRGGGEFGKRPSSIFPSRPRSGDRRELVEDDHHDRGVRANARDVHLHVVGEDDLRRGRREDEEPQEDERRGAEDGQERLECARRATPPPRLRRRGRAARDERPAWSSSPARSKAWIAKRPVRPPTRTRWRPRRARVDGGDGELDPEEVERRDERDREAKRIDVRRRRAAHGEELGVLPRMSRERLREGERRQDEEVDAPDDRLTEPPVRPSVLSLSWRRRSPIPGPAW